MPKIRFIPECHADTALMRIFVDNHDLIDHQAGLNEVANEMKNVKDKSYTLIGLIDDDKTKPPYFHDFEVLKDSCKYVLFKKKPNLEHFLIIIRPAFERFLIENAKDLSIDLNSFGLDNDMRILKKFTKKENIKTDPNFKGLLQTMKEQKAEAFVEIDEFIKRFQ